MHASPVVRTHIGLLVDLLPQILFPNHRLNREA